MRPDEMLTGEIERVGSLTLIPLPAAFVAWLERHLVMENYSPSVTSWLDFLADRLAAEFVRELQEQAAR
jgi:hypothetical protein